jgi:hypothetical protein
MANKINSETGWTNTFQMLADEFAQMYGERPSALPQAPDLKAAAAERRPGTPAHTAPTSDADLQKLYLDIHAPPAYPRTALCLSGGGIRSATFGLGVIQFLAKAGLLHRFEYISTVSGGGYIGSWLSAWLTRAGGADGKGGYAKVGAQLAGQVMPKREPLEIERLRANSNYLTPKLGALSMDTWSGVAIWLRNLLVNWFLLIPLFCAAAVTPQIISALGGAAADQQGANWVQRIGIVFYAISLIAFNGARPRWQAFNLNQPRFLVLCLGPLLVSAAMWAISMAHRSDLIDIWRPLIGEHTLLPSPIPDYIFLAVILYLAALVISLVTNRYVSAPYVRVSGCSNKEKNILRYSFDLSRPATSAASIEVFTEDHQAVAGKHYFNNSAMITFAAGQRERKDVFEVRLTDEPIDDSPVKDGDFFVKFRNPSSVRVGGVFGLPRAWDALAFLFSGACFGLFLGVGDFVLRPWITLVDGHINVWHHLGWSTLAVPWLLLSHALATVIFVAVTSWLPRSDEEREWIGRAAGWILVMAVLWTAIAGLVLILPQAIVELLTYIAPDADSAKSLAAVLLSAVGGVSGILTAIVGGGPKTAAIPGRSQGFSRGLVLYLGAPIFLATLFVGLALAVDWLAFKQIFGNKIAGATQRDFCPIVGSLVLYGYIPAIASVLIGLSININRFSLHEIYRNRLVRAFLGASNTRSTQRDLFTFFNFTDNIPVSRLWVRRNEREPTSPQPTTKPPAAENDWRPFHVLNIALNLVETEKLAWQQRKAESFTVTPLWCGSAQLDAYRRTSEYGGKGPITLGTAMAISGAAVSPNMGYNSSPLITFLLTLFNVRLGWWLGNPRREGFANDGPWLAALTLLYELFGLTNDRRKYVYLSDGGHFENLGLYEMVRRRCHLVIISDAGQDKDLAFADLANAVRKIYIDLGIRIEFPKLDQLRVRNKDRDKPDEGGPCYTVGRILYGEADGVSKDRDGYILYLKPGFRGDESADIVGYAAGSTDFPHETTADQWFSESQFESYRGLGFSIMERAHDAAVANYNNNKFGDEPIQDFRHVTTAEFFESLSAVERIANASMSIGAASTHDSTRPE